MNDDQIAPGAGASRGRFRRGQRLYVHRRFAPFRVRDLLLPILRSIGDPVHAAKK
jgi:hypothetical protein